MLPQQSINAPLGSTQGKPRRSLETISMWALFATLVVSIFAFIPSTAVPSSVTKTFLLATGTLITLALYILTRLGRGNVILPPFKLVGALWLPVVANNSWYVGRACATTFRTLWLIPSHRRFCVRHRRSA